MGRPVISVTGGYRRWPRKLQRANPPERKPSVSGGVAQVLNLPYRRLAVGWPGRWAAAIKRTLRRMQFCDTAEFNSALRDGPPSVRPPVPDRGVTPEPDGIR